MVKIKPEVDCAICVYLNAINICFAQIPDLEVVAEIYSLDDKNGVKVDEQCLSFGPSYLGEVPSARSEQQRLFYSVTIPPVFDSIAVARVLANCLIDDHGLKVKICDERGGFDVDRNIVLKR